MNAVWKYAISSGVTRLEVPIGATFLHADVQGGQACVWAIVDPASGTETRHILFRGTGYYIEHQIVRHIGTMLDGPFVWHVFEVK